MTHPCLVRSAATGLLAVCLGAVPAVFAHVGPPQQTPAKAEASPQLPPAREIIDRYVEAAGGTEAMARRTSRRTTGAFELKAQGVRGTMEVFSARPARQLARIDLPGFGVSEAVFDGTHGWSIDPALGPRLMQGKELERLRLLAEFDSALHRGDQYESIETVERTTFNGKDCYKVRVKAKSGVEWMEFYDVTTRLFAGMMGDQESPMGSIQVTTTVDDFKEFGGLLLPTTTVQKMAGGPEVHMTVTAIEFDRVDDKVFDMPAAIRTLAGK